jgi:hypothetical protein
MYEYVLPLVFVLMVISLIIGLVGVYSRKDKEKLRTWHLMLNYPIVIVFIIALIYYWISPFTEPSGRVLLTGIFILSLIAGPVSGRYLKTQLQKMLHYLLSIAALLAVLWFMIPVV